jgi:long-subunit fatty acid transport protein
LFFLPLFGWTQMGAPLVAGARGQGLAGAGLTFQDIHAAWANPAGLARLERAAFALYGEQRFGLSEIRHISGVGAVALGTGRAALILGNYGFEQFSQQRIGLAYARPLTEKLSLGLQLFGVTTSIPEYGNQLRLSAEVGAQLELTEQLQVGTRIANPLRIEVLDGEYLPTVFGLGIRYQPAPQVDLLAEVEKDILLPTRVRVGAEYRLLEAISVRVGVATQPTLLSFGVDYHLQDKWQLHFAAAYHQYLGFTPGIGMVYR